MLFLVGIFLIVQEGIDTRSDQEILSYYADGGSTGEMVGLLLVAVAVLFFLLFVSTLRNRLRSVELEPKSLSTLAFGAGVTSAALLIGSGALLVSTSFAAEFISGFVVDPNVVRFAFGTGVLFLMGSVLVNGVLVIATSVLALRTASSRTGWAGLASLRWCWPLSRRSSSPSLRFRFGSRSSALS